MLYLALLCFAKLCWIYAFATWLQRDEFILRLTSLGVKILHYLIQALL